MNRQILFIQGGGQGVHDEWDNQLVDSLRRELGHAYEIHYPRMPNEADPKYATWKSAIESALGTLQSGGVLVGHSIGATVLFGVLAERSQVGEFGAIVSLSAPFVGDGGWSSDDLHFPPDLGERLPEGVPVHFYHGLDDQEVPVSHVDLYARAVPRARVERLPGRDHQLNNDLREIAAAISRLEGQPESA
jgi:pimeloyl-ACP methyl ester carboxylesterase